MTQGTGIPYRVTLEITPYGHHLEVKTVEGYKIVTVPSTQESLYHTHHHANRNILWDQMPSYNELNKAVDNLYVEEAYKVASALYSEHRSGEDE